MHAVRTALVPGYLLLALTLGGASAAGFLSNMVLQLLALPLIAASILAPTSSPQPRSGQQLIALILGVIAVIIAQLVPLPESVWAALPGRSDIAEGFKMTGQDLPWLTLSLAPYKTISSALWILPAVAVILAVIRLAAFSKTALAWVVVGVTVVSVLIGALQVAGGDMSPLYFYAVTNRGSLTGFFANSNHQATLLVSALPFLAALYLQMRSRGKSRQRRSGLLVLLFSAVGIVFAGLVVNWSHAGLGLSIPVTVASALMILSKGQKHVSRWWIAAIPLLTIAAVAGISATPLGNAVVSEERSRGAESRGTMFSTTIKAAAEYAPAGSGVGTFQQIYRMHEDPRTVDTTYVNHAHGDYFEIALETGLPGMLVLIVFLCWWVGRCVRIWTAENADSFAMAASIASGAILAHSFVDYPLRTVALSVLFATCCTLMTERREWVSRRSQESSTKAKHLSAH